MKGKFLPVLMLVLLVFGFYSCDEDDKTPKPVAKFSWETENKGEITRILLKNESQNAKSYVWSLGVDSSIVTEVDTLLYYDLTVNADTLNFVVSLTASSKEGSDVYTDTIKLIGPAFAKFSFATDGGKVTFTNESRNFVNSFWSFGDNSADSISLESAPTHVFKKSGKYNVSLKVDNPKTGTVSTVDTVISIEIPAPDANFSWENAYPFKAVFSNSSKNAVEWRWDFGDGSTSDEENPTHKWEKQGVYKVTLTVKNSDGLESEKKADVKVLNPSRMFLSAVTYNKLSIENVFFYLQFGDYKSEKELLGSNLPFKVELPSAIEMDNLDEIREDEFSTALTLKYSEKATTVDKGLAEFYIPTADILSSYPEEYTMADEKGNEVILHFSYEANK